MARVTKISKHLGRTINTGNFNSIRVEAEAELELQEGDDLGQEDSRLFDLVSKMISDDLARIKEHKNGSK